MYKMYMHSLYYFDQNLICTLLSTHQGFIDYSISPIDY